ncbi:hypothetical protein ACN429_11660 [Pseudomonas oryzihabitans]|uniref:hypothetical protein n=1 Tax=Pseudomonas oryzihabitans TaxID=47885 RepID=UPI003B22277A
MESTKAYSFFTKNGFHGAFWRSSDSVSYYLPSLSPGRLRFVSFELNKQLFPDYLNDEAEFIEFALKNIITGAPVNPRSIGRSSLPINHYFPRVWRGHYKLERDELCSNAVSNMEEYGSIYVSSVVAAENIYRYLQEVFNYIDPCQENMGAFGPKLRELLILACTEVEGLWKGVLRANSTMEKARYSTKDYYALCELLCLKSWGVYLRDYPDLGQFSPFENWNSEQATQSLVWYEAYNAVKHDREKSANQATLKNVLGAMSAIHILLAAQWGPDVYSDREGGRRSPFELSNIPMFLASELYVTSFEAGGMIPVKYFDLENSEH